MITVLQRLHLHPRLLSRVRTTQVPFSSSRYYSGMIKMDPSPIQLDNSGTGPLRVPGFNGVPLFYEHSKENRFAHGIVDWRQTPQLFLRELSMLQFMSYVTEQPDWDNKSEDQQALQEWHQQAISVFDLDEPSWEWCVKELRDKASDFKRTGYVAVFDADSRVIKSQVHDDLLNELRESMSPLFSKSRSASSFASGDPHRSDSESPVRDVVDPFLYPLIYGRTRVLTNGGKIDMERPESWTLSKTQIAPIPEKPHYQREEMHLEERKEKAGGIPDILESETTGPLPFNIFPVRLL